MGDVAVKHGAVLLGTLDVNEAERVMIGPAREANGRSRIKAAELLGGSARSLQNKLIAPGKGEEDDGG
jgi:hypothetical protein